MDNKSNKLCGNIVYPEVAMQRRRLMFTLAAFTALAEAAACSARDETAPVGPTANHASFDGKGPSSQR